MTAPETRSVSLQVNGRLATHRIEPRLLLVDLLRSLLGLTGTHVGCSYGVCGACTVIVDGSPARSCLLLAASVDGAEVRTVEGLADERGRNTELQQAFSDEHGLQCGFCTPGLLCSLTAFLEGDPNPTPVAIDEVIAGHLCRCTGYSGIRRAARRAAGLPLTAERTKP